MSGALLRVPAIAWRLSKGYRFAPWKSPYLRWRIETYSGIHADTVTKRIFLEFSWKHRRELFRYLLWAGRMAQGMH